MSTTSRRKAPPAQALRASSYVDQVREHFRREGVHDEDGLADMEVVVAVMRLATRLVADFESVHRPLGTSWAGFRVMTVLSVTGDLEPSEIARLSFASRASISSVINTLEDAGFVARERDLKDRRSVRVSLTRAGQRALAEQAPVHARRERAWMQILSSGEREQLHEILRRLCDQPTPPLPAVAAAPTRRRGPQTGH